MESLDFSLKESSYIDDSYHKDKAEEEENNNNNTDTEVAEESDEDIIDDVPKALASVEVNLRIYPPSKFCPKCNTRINYTNLARHMKEVHDKVKYPCPDCGKHFLRKSALEKHNCNTRR